MFQAREQELVGAVREVFDSLLVRLGTTHCGRLGNYLTRQQCQSAKKASAWSDCMVLHFVWVFGQAGNAMLRNSVRDQVPEDLLLDVSMSSDSSFSSSCSFSGAGAGAGENEPTSSSRDNGVDPRRARKAEFKQRKMDLLKQHADVLGLQTQEVCLLVFAWIVSHCPFPWPCRSTYSLIISYGIGIEQVHRLLKPNHARGGGGVDSGPLADGHGPSLQDLLTEGETALTAADPDTFFKLLCARAFQGQGRLEEQDCP